MNQEATTQDFVIGEAEAGLRLDAFLAAQIENVSRARLQRAITDEEVLINGRPVKASHRLRAGEMIEIDLAEILSGDAPPEVVPEDAPLDVIYEDEVLIVINKPAGLTVHPGAGRPTGTLVNRLVFHFQHLANAGNGVLRPGIVHRLDADTSGVLVAAKTSIAHEKLAEQFRERAVKKHYTALVHGVMRDESGRNESPIGRDPRHRTRMAQVPVGAGGRTALTLYKVVRRFARFTELDVEIKSGRTHQIRVHLAAQKHPVVGDEIYNAGRDAQISDAQLRARIKHLNRHFLHAATLAFTHPTTNEFVRFRAPLPIELQAFLDALE